jgi:hypothetical protein
VAGVPPLLLPLVPGLREMFLQNEKKEEKWKKKKESHPVNEEG